VGEVSLRHEVVRPARKRGSAEIHSEDTRNSLEDAVDVGAVDTNRYPHQHVLRSFSDLAVDPQEVRTLEGLEAKVILAVVAVSADRWDKCRRRT
jgi:hypothetical protein